MRTQSALSKITILPDDIFLASYPRSGNTWVSFLLNKYVSCVYPHLWSPSQSIVGEIYKSSPEILAQQPRPRIIKIHSPYEAKLSRVIYLVRDARDVAVSYYYFYLKFRDVESISFKDYLEKFNLGKIDNYGIWNYHVSSWLDNRENSDQFLIIRYEDLKANTCETFSKIVNFIWDEVDVSGIEHAVEATEISRLQDIERQNNLFPDSNKEIQFFRKGIVGDWQNHFDHSILREFILFHGAGLRRLDYVSDDDLSTLIQRPDFSNPLAEHRIESQVYNLQKLAYEYDNKLFQEHKIRSAQKERIAEQEYRITHLETSLENLKADLEAKNSKLALLRRLNKQLKKQVNKSQKRLKNLEFRLKKKQKSLRRFRLENERIKASKFWKVYSSWHKLKAGIKGEKL